MRFLKTYFNKITHLRILAVLNMHDGVRLNFQDRETGDLFFFYALRERNVYPRDEFRVEGIRESKLGIPQIGREVIHIKDVKLIDLVPLSSLNHNQRPLKDKVKSLVDYYRAHLKYDERLCVYVSDTGERVYLGRNCNINECGFTAYIDDPRDNDEFGKAAVFVDWNLIAHYKGSFVFNESIEGVPGFQYHAWMDGDIRGKKPPKTVTAEERARLKDQLVQYRERRDRLDKELDKIILLLEQTADVHE